MLLPGYIPATCHKNNIVKLLVTSVSYYRSITCLLSNLHFKLRRHSMSSACSRVPHEPMRNLPIDPVRNCVEPIRKHELVSAPDVHNGPIVS